MVGADTCMSACSMQVCNRAAFAPSCAVQGLLVSCGPALTSVARHDDPLGLRAGVRCAHPGGGLIVLCGAAGQQQQRRRRCERQERVPRHVSDDLHARGMTFAQ